MTSEVITFGCRLNDYESSLIKQHADDAGLKNVVILNSCAVTSEAERQLRQAIRKIARERPEVKIVVTGCAAQIHPERYADMPEVHQVIGNAEKLKADIYQKIAIPISEKLLVNDIMSVQETASHMVQYIDGKSRAFLQVQNGCNHRCTFCIIPYGRGNSRSVPLGEIVNQAHALINNGYREIVLTGVDMTDYGSDLPGQPTFSQMIRRLLAHVPQIERLRLSSVDVAELHDEFFDILRAEKRLMPHIHLSLQAGDNIILKRMKRRHLREDVIKFCTQARAVRPEVVFGADIIAGFPTETDEMFQNTLNLLQELNIIHLHVFPYSEREGTPAVRMPQVDKKVRKERAAKIRELGKALLETHMRSQIGRTLKVLIEKSGFAHTEDFSIVNVGDIPYSSYGEIVNCGIVDYDGGQLIGNICNMK